MIELHKEHDCAKTESKCPMCGEAALREGDIRGLSDQGLRRAAVVRLHTEEQEQGLRGAFRRSGSQVRDEFAICNACSAFPLPVVTSRSNIATGRHLNLRPQDTSVHWHLAPGPSSRVTTDLTQFGQTFVLAQIISFLWSFNMITFMFYTEMGFPFCSIGGRGSGVIVLNYFEKLL
jgi:hypothetical protein